MESLPTEMVTTSEELKEACAHLSTCSHLGFDTEFVGEETYYPRLCLVQIATPSRLLIIDPLSCGPLDEFWDVLLHPDRTVIVHAGREEVRLCQLWTGRIPANLFDLQIVGGLVGLGYPLGHGALVSTVLDIQLAKGETLTEWRDRPLSDAQISYAFDDVRYLLPLYETLHARLKKMNRLEWSVEENLRLMEVSTATPEAEEKYRRLKGIGGLDRRKLSFVRGLHAWREKKAGELNRPARTVVRDDLLIEVARRNPKRDRDLQMVRGLARRYIGEMIEVIAEAREIPNDQCPAPVQRDQDSPPVTHMAQVLTAVLSHWCSVNHVSISLAATSKDVKQLVRARRSGKSPTGKSILLRGWRAQHILPRLEAMLEGRGTLTIDNIRSDNPFSVEITERTSD